jgi:hypothetical protein
MMRRSQRTRRERRLRIGVVRAVVEGEVDQGEEVGSEVGGDEVVEEVSK